MMHHESRYPRVTPSLGLVAAALLAVACVDDPVAPLDTHPGPIDAGAAPNFAVHLTCTVDVTVGGMTCEPSSPASPAGGPNLNVIVGSQDQFVRLANPPPTLNGDTLSADVTVQNLTLQSMGTLDGATPSGYGIKVFFVDEPNNGVVVLSHDGEGAFLSSEPTEKYHEYVGQELGEDEVLSPAETSSPKTWRFERNGAEEFTFSVLIATEVPSKDAYGIHLTRVDAGGSHACGETADGKVYCWGNNAWGALGDGTNTDRHTPTEVVAPGGISLSNVNAGGGYACAEGGDGELYCWGDNSHGQLGNGTTDGDDSPVPVDAPPGVTLTNPSVATHHGCAQGDDGELYCWGTNNRGQLGDGSTNNSTSPVRVIAPAGVTLTNVSAGHAHTCAQGDDGELYCWGDNTYGALGDGTTTNSSTPARVLAPAGVTLSNVSAANMTQANHTCADGDDGAVYCWGKNQQGQLGDGTWNPLIEPRPEPTAVNAPAGVALSNVNAGEEFTCAQGDDGNAYCWGRNLSNRLGDGSTPTVPRTSPTRVDAPAGVTLSNPAAGSNFGCALGPRGTAYCWGNNGNGRVGDGTTSPRGRPVIVAGTGGPNRSAPTPET